MSSFTIGKLAQAAQVRIDTIRFYEKAGLLQPQRRPSGFREFSHADIERLVFIRRARVLGFSLEEIAQLLQLETDAEISKLSAIVEAQLGTIDQKLDELRSWRNALVCWRDRSNAQGGGRPSLVQTMTASGGGD